MKTPEEYEKVTMSLITNHIRAIVGKIKNKEKLTADEQTYAANALIEYAEKLDRRAVGHTVAESKNEEQRQRVLRTRILQHHARLAGIEIEKRKAGRQPKIK